MIAEYKPATGDWSDYIYANGQRIARADTFEDRIHIWGTNCSNCGWQNAGFVFTDAGGNQGYQIRNGDILMFRQYQSTGAVGGVYLGFSDATYAAWDATDQDGQAMNSDTYHNLWHVRRVNLSSYAGKVLDHVGLDAEGYTQPGYWQIYYNEIVLVSADGSVRPIYNRGTSVSLPSWASSGVTGLGQEVNHWGNWGAYTDTTTTFYHGDHLGSSRLMTSYNGYPLWQGTFVPFGYEYNAQTTTNHYKFTGLERESAAEGGLDHTWFRQYASVQGRWLTPDPAGLAAVDLANPQSWNRYAYVTNQPTSYVDPDGMNEATSDAAHYRELLLSSNSVFAAAASGSFWMAFVPTENSNSWMWFSSDAFEAGTMVSSTDFGYWMSVGSLGLSSSWGTVAVFGATTSGSAGQGGILSSARLQGESFTQCFDRVQKSVLGDTGQTLLNSIFPVSLILKGASVPLGPPVVEKVVVAADRTLTVTTRASSLLEVGAGFAVREGMLPAGAIAAVRSGAPVISRVAALALGAAAVAEASFALACR